MQVYVPASPSAASAPEVEFLKRGRLSDADAAAIAAVMRAACLPPQVPRLYRSQWESRTV